MFTLSDDKSAYATLVGLKALLEKDVANLRVRAQNYSARSHDYTRITAEIGAYNSVLATIMSVDVYQAGERSAKQHTHWHMTNPSGETYSADDPELLRHLMMKQGATTGDAFLLLSQGFLVRQCIEAACFGHGHWLAELAHAPK